MLGLLLSPLFSLILSEGALGSWLFPCWSASVLVFVFCTDWKLADEERHARLPSWSLLTGLKCICRLHAATSTWFRLFSGPFKHSRCSVAKDEKAKLIYESSEHVNSSRRCLQCWKHLDMSGSQSCVRQCGPPSLEAMKTDVEKRRSIRHIHERLELREERLPIRLW